MVAKKSPASGNKPAGAKKATSAPQAAKGWGAGANAGNGTPPEPPRPEEGFTTDSPSGVVPPEQPAPEQPAPEPSPSKETKRSKGRSTSAGHTPAHDASDDAAINLSNMTSDLVKGVESLERIAEEISVLKDDGKEFLAELKSKGYSTKIIRQVLRRRAMDPDKRKEEDSLLDLYEEAIRGA